MRSIDILPSEARPFLGLGILSGLEQCPNVISGARHKPPLRPDLSWTCFKPWRAYDGSWGVTLKATGYSNIYKHRKSRQISRSSMMMEGPRGIMKGLSRWSRLKHSLHNSGPRFPIGGPWSPHEQLMAEPNCAGSVLSGDVGRLSLFGCTYKDHRSPTWI